jgi:hypothetical protein
MSTTAICYEVIVQTTPYHRHYATARPPQMDEPQLGIWLAQWAEGIFGKGSKVVSYRDESLEWFPTPEDPIF